MIKNISLNGKWKASGGDERTGERVEFEGNVPSSALYDLLLSGKAEGLTYESVFWRDNSKLVQKYEYFDWIYSRDFELDAEDLREGRSYTLHFERLDTYCGVYLNGSFLGEFDDGYIAYDIDVSGKVKAGKNSVEVRLYSPVTRVSGKPRPGGAFTTERMNTRRVQCTYGWDWTERFVTCGIGEASLTLCDRSIRPESVYVYTGFIDGDGAQIGIDTDFTDCASGGGLFEFVISSPDGAEVRRVKKYVAEAFCRLTVDIPSPLLWYPAGYGESPLYTIEIKKDGETLISKRFGIRTVRILQLPDEPDSEYYEKCRKVRNPEYDRNESFSGFTLKVNGVKIMCMGANWVPCEPFDADIGRRREKITRTLELARGAGVNMLRVWGGGAFECEHFYDECSRLGIMVTQDFLMACGQYPEKQPWFIEHLKAEAGYAAKLIRGKACLAWFSGDNENAVMGSDTQSDYTGRDSAYLGIAPVLYEKAAHTAFLPSSPYGGDFYASNTVGTTHVTQYLGSIFQYISGGDASDFVQRWKNYRARFIAEEPAMGAVCRSTLDRFMTEEDILGDDLSMWQFHTKNNPGLGKTLFDYTLELSEKLFGGFTDGSDRYFKLRYLHYEWMRVSMEQARREKWFCSGIIYWMLNDCWPAASGWAIIDWYLNPKAAYYCFKRLSKPVIVSLDCEEGRLSAYVSSNSLENRKVKLIVREIDIKSGIISRICDKTVESEANSSAKAIPLDYSPAPDKLVTALLLSADTDDGADGDTELDRTSYKSGAPKLIPAKIKFTYDAAKGEVSVSSERYVHAVALEGVGAAAVFSDNYFQLLPGEIRTVKLLGDSPAEVTAEAYTFA